MWMRESKRERESSEAAVRVLEIGVENRRVNATCD